MAPYRSGDRPRRSWPRERGTLAHFAGGEGIHPDDVERDDMPPSKRAPRGGDHRGRGPTGYVRRDERIHEDVCERLSQDHELDASDIEVRVLAGEVTLDGTVTAGWARRRAEELAAVSGVRHVENNLRVRDRRHA